jgi:hypothetical protein
MVQGLPWWQALLVLVPWALAPIAGTQYAGTFGGGFIGAVLAGGVGGAIGGGAASLSSTLARRSGNAGLKAVAMICVGAVAYGGFFGVVGFAGRVIPQAPASALAPPPQQLPPSPTAITLSTPASCPRSTTTASAEPASMLGNVFGVSSAPGNKIDGGHTSQWGGPALTVSGSASGAQISAEGWAVELDPAQGGALGCGTYPGAAESRLGTTPYLSVSIGGTDCGAAEGTFTIHQIAFTPSGAIGLLNADFGQRCTANSAPLVGYVRYGATAPTRLPALPSTAGPVTAPAHVATTSANSDEFYASSSQGDVVGQGRHVDIPGSSVVVEGNLGQVHISAAGWSAVLSPRTGEQLVPGTYSGAVRFASSSAPEIMVGGVSGDCETNDYGTFTVYQISADAGGRVTALNATFSQSCNTPSAPPLVGFIRFHATEPTPVPTTPAHLSDPAAGPTTAATASP